MKNLLENQELKNHFASASKKSLKELFNEDKNRFEKYSLKIEDMLVDFSKNPLEEKTISIFEKIAKDNGFLEFKENMFLGKNINNTENRAVLHTALRNKEQKPLLVDGVDVYDEVWTENTRFLDFAEKVRNGEIVSKNGKPFSDIVNVGIGGSYLGVEMLCHSLESFGKEGIKIHFISNVDGSNTKEVLKKVNLDTALFIIASKTFTTQETIMNANMLKEHVSKKLGEDFIATNFVALSTNLKEVENFGIKKEYTFGFWDFIGGRYSVWSSIGLALAILIGKKNFEALMEGAKIIDENFRAKELSKNIPFILGVIGIINRNFYKRGARAFIPYSYYLRDLARYLQQLDMESNGKYIDKEGNRVNLETGSVIFGEPGTDSQHSFFQLLHQGSDIIPVDFIGFVKSTSPYLDNHEALMANMFAQTEALMKGKTKEEVKKELLAKNMSEGEINRLLPHKCFEGNRPSVTILFKELTPKAMGMLCSLYEHKVATEGFFWNINSYDQFGVELGKELAKNILNDFAAKEEVNNHDTSTNNLINYYKSNK